MIISRYVSREKYRDISMHRWIVPRLVFTLRRLSPPTGPALLRGADRRIPRRPATLQWRPRLARPPARRPPQAARPPRPADPRPCRPRVAAAARRPGARVPGEPWGATGETRGQCRGQCLARGVASYRDLGYSVMITLFWNMIILKFDKVRLPIFFISISAGYSKKIV